MVNDTVLNFGKRYKDNLRVIFDQWQKLHLGLEFGCAKQSKNLEMYLFYMYVVAKEQLATSPLANSFPTFLALKVGECGLPSYYYSLI